ncbi:MAG: preprotein translocase subunit SecG [Verrucomicrobiales bacterium]|nr:preprotein translocase subunit SecG [Verrucomicrobiales bacterium]
MTIVIGFLTLILVLISVFLILLVLVQLPKKEAGVGMAFGAGMSEMILGAGSGNVLTRITKYTVGSYLVLALALSVLIAGKARKENQGVIRAIEDKARSAPMSAIPQPPAANQGLQSLTGSVANAVSAPLVSTTTVVNPAPATTPAPAPAGAPKTP